MYTSSFKEVLDRDGERGFDYLTFALVSSKAHRKSIGLRVVDSHTGNHPKGGFTPLETIRRLLVVIGRRSHSGFKGEAFEPGDEVNTKPPKNVKGLKVQPAKFTADSGESLKAGVFVVHPGSVAARIKERKCKTREVLQGLL
ncbi:hypothetical protein Tco_1045032 [Tanacetum coccineum]|uniref:Uncharacterized protein n=1 Tax=Tanacetum coccineum TaxID=301880 RepID=A0ABQ5GTT7_9ASTR